MTQVTSQPQEGLYLGKPVFGVTHEGKVRQTAIGRLAVPRRPDPQEVKQLEGEYGEGDILLLMHRMANTQPEYSVLDSNLRDAKLFFSLDEATTEAQKILEARLGNLDITGREKEWIRIHLTRLGGQGWREEILAQPLVKRGDTCFIEDHILGDGQFPAEYFRPGERVYGIITPDTHHCVTPEWRPHPYFVLVTAVEEVSYAPAWPGMVYYNLGTRYSISHPRLYACEADVRREMTLVFEQQTCGTLHPENVKVIDVSEEKKAHDRFFKEIVENARTRRVP